jgi:predicted Zn-dependent protease
LAAYGEAKVRFPENAVCHTGYAEMLRSMGRNTEALQAYNAAQSHFPNNRVLLNAKACLLISLGNYQEARDILATGRDSRDDHVLAMSYFYEGDFATAESLLRAGVEKAVVGSKVVFETSLAVLLIKQNKAEEVLRQWQDTKPNSINAPEQTAVYAHALAACNQLEAAKLQLGQLAQAPPRIIRLADFLQQRYWAELASAEQARLDDAIYHDELALLLAA